MNYVAIKNLDYYKEKYNISRPRKSEFDKIYLEALDTFKGTLKECLVKKEELLAESKEDYKEHLKIHANNKNAVLEEFKADLEKEFGLENHPKKDDVNAFVSEHCEYIFTTDYIYFYESVANLLID